MIFASKSCGFGSIPPKALVAVETLTSKVGQATIDGKVSAGHAARRRRREKQRHLRHLVRSLPGVLVGTVI